MLIFFKVSSRCLVLVELLKFVVDGTDFVVNEWNNNSLEDTDYSSIDITIDLLFSFQLLLLQNFIFCSGFFMSHDVLGLADTYIAIEC